MNLVEKTARRKKPRLLQITIDHMENIDDTFQKKNLSTVPMPIENEMVKSIQLTSYDFGCYTCLKKYIIE